jgi:O-antigen/teichoic acid export membrane protein
MENSLISKPATEHKNPNNFLFSTIIIYFIGTFISKAASFFLLPLITNSISSADYGDFDLVSSIVLVATPIFSLQITEALYRFLFKAEKNDEKSIVFDSFVVIITGIGLCAISFAIVDSFIYSIPYCWLTFAYYCATIFLDALQKIARSKGYTKQFAASGVIDTLAMISIQCITLLVLNWSAKGLLIGYIFGAITGAIYLSIRMNVFKYLKFENFSLKKLREMLKYSAPLIPNNISWWVAELVNKVIIIAVLSQSAQGIYAITSKFTAVLVLFTDVFKLSWNETAINFYDSSKGTYYSESFDRFIRVLFLGCNIVIPFIYLIFPYFIGDEYQPSLQYIPLAMYASCLSSIVSFYGTGYSASKKTNGAFFTSILGMAINVGLCYWLINVIGLYAVPISGMIAYTIIWIIRQISMKSYFPIRPKPLTIVALVSLAVLTSVVFYFGNIYLNVASFLISIIIFLLANIRVVTFCLNKFFKRIPVIGFRDFSTKLANNLRGKATFFKILFFAY